MPFNRDTVALVITAPPGAQSILDDLVGYPNGANRC